MRRSVIEVLEKRPPACVKWGIFFVVLILIVIAFSVPIVVNVKTDEEETLNGIISTFLQSQSLLNGKWSFWYSGFALGTPLPLVSNLDFHPVLYLFMYFNPSDSMKLFYLIQILVGACGFFVLAIRLSVKPILALAGVMFFLLSYSNISYLYVDDWPGMYLIWSTSPWLFWSFIEWIYSKDRRSEYFFASLFGLLYGYLTLQTNVIGNLFPYASALVVSTAFSASRRNLISRWRSLVLIGALVVTVSAHELFHLLSEINRFPEEAVREVLGPYSLKEQIGSIFRLGGTWPVNDFRTIHYGAALFVMSIISLFIRYRDRKIVFIKVVFCVSCILVFIPADRFNVNIGSAIYMHRDPLTIMGIVLALSCVSRISVQPRTIWIPMFLITISFLDSFANVYPILDKTTKIIAGKESPHVMYQSIQENKLIRLLKRLQEDNPGRVVFTAGFRERHFYNSFGYHGIPVVNSELRGVAQDKLYPGLRQGYGEVYVDNSIFSSPKTLAMLGVRYVVSTSNGNGIGARNGYRVIGRIRTAEDGEVVILENEFYKGGAVLLAGDLRKLREEQFIAGCSHKKILCRNLEKIYDAIDKPVPDIKAFGSINIDISSTPLSSGVRYIWLSETYRPGWQSNNEKAEPVEIIEGFLGLKITNAVMPVEIHYLPPFRIATLMITLLGLITGLLLLFVYRPKDYRDDLIEDAKKTP